MSEDVAATGIRVYGLAGNWCKECGRAKMNRLHGALTGCKTCDEVVTRHRCTEQPSVTALAAGSRWTCRECGSAWAVVTSTEACPDCCGECGHMVTVSRWEVTADYRDSGPRRQPRYSPLRNLLFPVYPSLAAAFEAEGEARRAWIAGMAERLGLVLMKDGNGDQ